MHVLVTGGRGMLGKSVLKKCKKKGDKLFVADLPEIDVTDEKSVKNCFLRVAPDVVIHAAAFTDVDGAETEEEKAFAVNFWGTENVAKEAKACGAKMVYISTDYVFSGDGDTPWKTEDTPAPVNVYGKSKLAGERAVARILDNFFIVRTAWLFGEGKNFVRTMLNLGRERLKISVVCDQYGSPTFADDLGEFLSELIHTERYGVYHVTNSGYCSWAQFAKEIFSMASEFDGRYKSVIVEEILGERYPTKAKRPKNGRLDKSKLEQNGFRPLPHYTDGLKRYLEQVWKNS